MNLAIGLALGLVAAGLLWIESSGTAPAGECLGLGVFLAALIMIACEVT